MSQLSHQVYGGIGVNNRLDAVPEQAQSAVLTNIADIEDSVDAMGNVAFADEEDCGFFGMIGEHNLLRNLQHLKREMV
jgi:hypothetical protein